MEQPRRVTRDQCEHIPAKELDGRSIVWERERRGEFEVYPVDTFMHKHGIVGFYITVSTGFLDGKNVELVDFTATPPNAQVYYSVDEDQTMLVLKREYE
jgi:hypothetical protein